MTIKEILKGKDCEFVEVRKIYEGDGLREDVFTGAFKVVGGEIIPLDHDTYSLAEEYDGYTFWGDGDGKTFNDVNIRLTVWKTEHTNH